MFLFLYLIISPNVEDDSIVSSTDDDHSFLTFFNIFFNIKNIYFSKLTYPCLLLVLPSPTNIYSSLIIK